MLVLRVSAHSLQGQSDVPDSRGVSVRVGPTYTTSNEVDVELVLTDSEHTDIFDMLVLDLVTVAEQPNEERAALTRFLNRLSDWQHLLRRLAPRGLSPESQQGLWGELWVLREVVTPAAGLREAVKAWRGPLGADQDFQLGTACIEVKSTTANRLDRIGISSERQLEVPNDVNLLLVTLSLDARFNHGQTLPGIIGAVRAAASTSGCLHLFDDRLQQYGYQNDDASSYGEIGFSIRSIRAFQVTPDFPKIVSNDLHPGISNVKYSLSVAACGQFKWRTQVPTEILDGLV